MLHRSDAEILYIFFLDPTPAKKLAKRRRKPLLLFFPEHNQSVFLGSYRCLLLADRLVFFQLQWIFLLSLLLFVVDGGRKWIQWSSLQSCVNTFMN